MTCEGSNAPPDARAESAAMSCVVYPVGMRRLRLMTWTVWYHPHPIAERRYKLACGRQCQPRLAAITQASERQQAGGLKQLLCFDQLLLPSDDFLVWTNLWSVKPLRLASVELSLQPDFVDGRISPLTGLHAALRLSPG